jgi:prepilin-type N-terminal cleavage/methylation domain-containing protein
MRWRVSDAAEGRDPGARRSRATRSAAASRASLSEDAGITLIELIVVLAIVGLLALGVGTGVLRLTRSVLRQDATRIAAVIRTGFDRALASGAHHRLILDLDEKSFHLERCEGKVTIMRARTPEEIAEKEAAAAEDLRKLAESDPNDVVGQVLGEAGRKIGGGGGAAQAPCEPVAGELGKPRSLDKGKELKIAEVRVEHLEDPVTSGKVTINFFPQGFAERAVVEVSTAQPVGDDDVYSILLHPLSGRVEIRPGELRGKDDFLRRDATGQEDAER